MAIDPIFIGVGALEDFERAGGVASLADATRQKLRGAQASPRINHDLVRAVKTEGLDRAFDRFLRDEWAHGTQRGAALAAYIDREGWWLDDYALFQAVTDAVDGLSWRQWPPPLRDRMPHAIEEARDRLGRPILRQQYLQWVAETQWQQARAAAHDHGVRIVGDLPFVVATDSADVWARSGEFMLDASAGVPPDGFSATGQDWGLPVYRWDRIAAGGYTWMRQRARRMAGLFDGIRVDHLVGFYRTYGKPPQGEPFFIPADEPTQTRQGEAILRIFLESGAEILAEDLGTVPDFVRASLARVGVPGTKVLRWERAWHSPGQPFLDPVTYSPASVAMTGTHDNETLAQWWDNAVWDERAAFLQLPLFQAHGATDPGRAWDDRLRDLVIASAYTAGSDQIFLTAQDLFGWRDRINIPATVGDWNWTWRLPWRVDALVDTLPAMERAAFSEALAKRTMRA
jgi:4-alpha-glucanotransferase